jgi:triosephosphate isomerase
MKFLIIGNWKCNPLTQKEAGHLFKSIGEETRKIEVSDVVLCPPFVWLSSFSSSAKGAGKIKLGAQDGFWERKGAYTGEVSMEMLKNLGCRYVILGHSERRKHFQETDEIINKKIKSALSSHLKPVLCVGEESQDSFDSEGRSLEEVSLKIGTQLEKAVAGLSAGRVRELTVAYEPVWAIGSGNPCSPDYAMKSILFLRKTLTKIYDRKTAEKINMLYGGSVDSKNALSYLQETGINGLLIGGASLNASEFNKVVKKIEEEMK